MKQPHLAWPHCTPHPLHLYERFSALDLFPFLLCLSPPTELKSVKVLTVIGSPQCRCIPPPATPATTLMWAKSQNCLMLHNILCNRG